MQKGSIGVTTDNIFPVIKKFLYSDHEIFLRELVSNAVDATQKLKTLAAVGDFKGELGNLNVEVSIDKEAGTLTVSDHGIYQSDCLFGCGRIPRKIQKRRQRHHRTLRIGILFFVHGFKKGRNTYPFLSGRCTGRHVELRRISRVYNGKYR